MKTAWALIILAIATLGGATLLLAGISNEAVTQLKNSTNPNTEAAYRDGLYHARLQAQRGEEPHVAVGRWQRVADRDLFVAGFRDGYAEVLAAHPELKQRLENLQVEGVRFAEQTPDNAPSSANSPEI